MSTVATAKRFVELSAQKRRLEGELVGVKAELRALGEGLLQSMIEEGVPRLSVESSDGEGLVYMHEQTWAKPKDGDRHRLVRVLEALGMGDLVTYNSQSLSSYVREALASESLPEPLREVLELDVRVQPRVRFASK